MGGDGTWRCKISKFAVNFKLSVLLRRDNFKQVYNRPQSLAMNLTLYTVNGTLFRSSVLSCSNSDSRFRR